MIDPWYHLREEKTNKKKKKHSWLPSINQRYFSNEKNLFVNFFKILHPQKKTSLELTIISPHRIKYINKIKCNKNSRQRKKKISLPRILFVFNKIFFPERICEKKAECKNYAGDKDAPLPLQGEAHVDQISGSAGGVNLEWQSKAETPRFFRWKLTAVSTVSSPVPSVQIQCHLRTRQSAAWNESRDS